MTIHQRIMITPGEPAGIGPDVTLKVAQQSWPAELVVIADPELLTERAKQLDLSIELIECDPSQAPTPHQPGTLKIIPVALNVSATPGKLDVANAEYVLKTLELAAALCLQATIPTALVTGPVNKEILNQAGIVFTGHTEFLAQQSQTPLTVMMFVVDDLKVALATTHLPLADVPKAITKELLQKTFAILNMDLKKRFHLSAPRILVCGLNPHAGEGGYLGREEIETITPVIKDFQQQDYLLSGPLPADTIFTPKHLQQADAILAMYHDQALPLIKYLGFDRAVNVTLGLPFVRTSVDHGTAIDIAGTNIADAGSMTAAIKLAIEML